MHLANTTVIKKYEGLKHSGDEADTRDPAHLLRLGISHDQPYIAAFDIPEIRYLKIVMPEVYRGKPLLVSGRRQGGLNIRTEVSRLVTD